MQENSWEKRGHIVHQKKRKKMLAGALLMFFVLSGAWYYAAHFRSGEASGLQADRKAEQQGEADKADRADKADDTSGQGADGQGTGPSSAAEPVYVFLCGCVASEGVYKLFAGARLYEAIELAGGFTEDADETYHNLARAIVDGERVYIPSKQETEAFALGERIAGGEQGRDSSLDAPKAGKVNLNTATKEELMTLSGIGAAKAADIIEYRQKVGAFDTIEEVMNISGIGTAMFEKIKEQITVK